MNKEEILCVRRERLPSAWLGLMTALSLEKEECLATIEKAGFDFFPRLQVESDPRYKQIIPYVMVQEKGDGKFASYRREGNEPRLHALTSCGIGGHISKEDGGEGICDVRKVIYRGCERELREEFVALPSVESLKFLGVINEDCTAVGSVHFGLVFLLEIKSSEGVVPGEELRSFEWLSKEELMGRNLELWSRLALTFIDAG